MLLLLGPPVFCVALVTALLSMALSLLCMPCTRRRLPAFGQVLHEHMAAWGNLFVCPLWTVLFVAILVLYLITFVLAVLVSMVRQLVYRVFCCRAPPPRVRRSSSPAVAVPDSSLPATITVVVQSPSNEGSS